MKRGKTIIYSKQGGTTLRDLAIVAMYVFGLWRMKYSGNVVITEEELDIEVLHYQFLRKYNLLYFKRIY